MRRHGNSLTLLPALGVVVATLLALVEWTASGGGPGWWALWSLWSFAVLLPALVCAAAALRLHWLRAELAWLAMLWPSCCLVFHQLAHELAWPHLALGVGGLQHWSRVWAIVAVALLLPSVLLGRASRRLAQQWMPGAQAVLSLLAVLAVTVGFWTSFAPAPPAARAKAGAEWPNILLLSIDTLRQDALAPYGGPATALDPWLRRGVALDGWAPAPWTLPSLHAMMRGASLAGGSEEPRRAVPESDPWWPERLRDAGYETAAVLTNVHLVQDFAFERGFDRYDHADRIEWLHPAEWSLFVRFATRQWTERRQIERGDHRADRAIEMLREMPEDRPWLLWMHMIDPHLPYYLRGEGGAVSSKETPAWIADLGESFENEKFFDLPGMRKGVWPREGAFLQALRRLYAREVDFAAFHAARVLAAADEASEGRPWIWILTSDHGEEFFEHGGFEHGHALTPEVLRVPLVFGGVDVEQLPLHMRLQDIGPWLLSRLSQAPLPSPSPLLQGELAAAVLGSDVPPEGCVPALLATHILYGPSQTRWIRPDGGNLLWDAEGKSWRGDLCMDPEDRLRSAADPDSLERELWDLLTQWRTEENATATLELDAQLLERLRALGYTQ